MVFYEMCVQEDEERFGGMIGDGEVLGHEIVRISYSRCCSTAVDNRNTLPGYAITGVYARVRKFSD